MNDTLCPWEPAQYLIFSENVPDLLFYSHFTAISAVIIASAFIFLVAKRNLMVTLMHLLFWLFVVWAFTDIIVWATNRPEVVMFWWSVIVLIEPIIYVVAFYLFYAFVRDRVPPFSFNLGVFAILLPLLFFSPTTLNLSAVNLYDCAADEGFLARYYTYGIEFLAIASILFVFFAFARRANKAKNLLFAAGLLFFLMAFSSGNIIGSMTGDWDLAQYGLFGMPVFIGILSYLIVRYQAFAIKLIGAQALVVTLWFLVGSLLFVAQSIQTRVVAGVTLVLVSIFGYILVKSVKKEVEQREEISKLAETLAQANERLKVLDKMKSEFVSIASHQLRSPLTAIRGYASMLVEGSYGALSSKAQEAANSIAESAKYMALSVEDYLNVSRIEAGNMKYEIADFNLREVTEKIVDELRPVALKKGLVMVFRSDCNGSCSVHADIGKTRQVIMNLLDNSMKYTPKGTITVIAHDDVKKKKMYVTINDTGVGMSKETQEEVFDKFVRAKNANNVNTTGTGLGLYVAKKMITDMKGRVWAESEGEGKGSTFHIELPLLPGTYNR